MSNCDDSDCESCGKMNTGTTQDLCAECQQGLIDMGRRQAFEEAAEIMREPLAMARRYPGCAIVRHSLEDGIAALEARAKEE